MAEAVQKLAFHICWDSVDFGIIFTCFLSALGQFLMKFGALETGLKLDDFRWLSGGPELNNHGRFVVSFLSVSNS